MVSHVVMILSFFVSDIKNRGLVGTSKDSFFRILLKQSTVFCNGTVQCIGSSVFYMVIRAVGIIAGPGPVIDSVYLDYIYRFSEVCQAIQFPDGILLNTHHIIAQLYDPCSAVAVQQIGFSVVIGKDARINSLTDPCSAL